MCSETVLVDHNLLTMGYYANLMSIVHTEKELLSMIGLSVKETSFCFQQ